jgi:hypothetical protein
MSNISKITIAYYKLLSSIDWSDEVLILGIREGLNKFLSNAHLKLANKHKYLQGNFYSRSAAEKVEAGDFNGLVYEHMVPKAKYIQKPCEEKAKIGDLTIEFIETHLDKYWKIAVITKEEDKRLSRASMPKNWNEKNIFIRYTLAGIELIELDS